MSRSRSFWRVVAILMAMTMLMSVATPALAKKPNTNKPPIDVQILGLNDFHGMLEAVPATSTSGARIGNLTSNACVAPVCVPAGGVEYLATTVAQPPSREPEHRLRLCRRPHRRHAAALGAVPRRADHRGLQPHGPRLQRRRQPRVRRGHHRAAAHAVRQRAGLPLHAGHARTAAIRSTDAATATPSSAPTSTSSPRTSPTGTRGDTIFPPYAVHDFPGGDKVAFVGMTLEGTPLIVSPDGIAIGQLPRRGGIGERARPASQATRGSRRSSCCSTRAARSARAPVVGHRRCAADQRLATTRAARCLRSSQAMDDEIDIVITGHTNWAVNCIIDGKVVTGAASQGRLDHRHRRHSSTRTGDFVPGAITVNNKIVTRDVPQGRRPDRPDRRVQRLRRTDRRRSRRLGHRRR